MHAATMPFTAGGASLQQVPRYLNCVHQQSVCSRKLASRSARSLKLDAQEGQTQSSVRDSSTSSSGRLHDTLSENNGTGRQIAPVAVQQSTAVSTSDDGNLKQLGGVHDTSKSQSPAAWYAAVGLSAIAALICSVDRAAISVAILPMSEEFGWSDSTKGAINR